MTISQDHRVTAQAGTKQVAGITVNGTLEGGHGNSGTTGFKLKSSGDVSVGATGTIKTPDYNLGRTNGAGTVSDSKPTGNLQIECGNLNNAGKIRSGNATVKGAGTGNVSITATGNVTNSGPVGQILSGDDGGSVDRTNIGTGKSTGKVTVTANGGQVTNGGQIRSGDGAHYGSPSGNVKVKGKTGVTNSGHVLSGNGAKGSRQTNTSDKQKGGKSGDVSVESPAGPVTNGTGATIVSGQGGNGSEEEGTGGDGGDSGKVKVKGKTGVTNNGDISSGGGGKGGDGGTGGETDHGDGGKGGKSGDVKVSGHDIGVSVGTGVRVTSGPGGEGGDAKGSNRKGGAGGNSGSVTAEGYGTGTKANTVTGEGQIYGGRGGDGGVSVPPVSDGSPGNRGKARLRAKVIHMVAGARIEGGSCVFGAGIDGLNLAGAPSGTIIGDEGVEIRSSGPVNLTGIPVGTMVIQSPGGQITFYVNSVSQIQLDPGVMLADITEPDAVVIESTVLAPVELEATAVGRSQILLWWWDLADNDMGYRIERFEDPGWIPVTTTDPGDPAFYLDSDLAPGEQRTYRVAAVTTEPPDFLTGYTNEATATTATGYPEWKAAKGIVDDLEDADGNGLTAIEEYCLGINSAEENASPQTAYGFAYSAGLLSFLFDRPSGRDDVVPVIEANPQGDLALWPPVAVDPADGDDSVFFDIESEGLARNFVRLRTMPADADMTPVNLSALALSPTEIELTWDNGPIPPEEIRVRRSMDGIEFETIDVVPGGAPGSYIDITVTDDTPYCYVIRALRADIAAPVSKAAAVKTLPGPP